VALCAGGAGNPAASLRRISRSDIAMATLLSFIGTWNVAEWKPNDKNFKFLLDNRKLTIVGDQKLKLTWADGRSRRHEIHFDSDNESEGQISSGPVEIEGFTCIVALTVPSSEVLNDRLKGAITAAVPHARRLGDGPVGTFIAEASGGNEGLDAPRLEESITV
jgi:hypothetical protein